MCPQNLSPEFVPRIPVFPTPEFCLGKRAGTPLLHNEHLSCELIFREHLEEACYRRNKFLEPRGVNGQVEDARMPRGGVLLQIGEIRIARDHDAPFALSEPEYLAVRHS